MICVMSVDIASGVQNMALLNANNSTDVRKERKEVAILFYTFPYADDSL